MPKMLHQLSSVKVVSAKVVSAKVVNAQTMLFQYQNSFPLIGTIPDLEVHSTRTFIFPKILLGKWTVLFSHPGDFTQLYTEFVSLQIRPRV